ncbi:MAG: VWA domain-containing protein [Bryobacteraceae bacterium]
MGIRANRFAAVGLGVAALILAQSERVTPEGAAGDSVKSDSRPARVSIEPRSRPATDTERRPGTNLRIDANLVLINATVVSSMNQVVTGLEQDIFRIFEDKVEQAIKHLSTEDAPISIGLVFDTSRSMGPKLNRSRKAVAEFLKTANPQDEFFLVQFDDRPELKHDFTTDPADIQTRLAFTRAKGKTALLDGVKLALDTMKKAHRTRKALLVISDGADNSSRYTVGEVRNEVRESDVLIYAIGLYESMSARQRSAEEVAGPSLLNDICEQTGGRHFAVGKLSELPDVAAKIGAELRNQYVLGYTPANQVRDGKYRRVEVKLKQSRSLPHLRVFHRQGYYAPER